MMKKHFITLALVLTAKASLAVTIDLPGYDFAAIAQTASLAPQGEGAFDYNFSSAVDDISDAYATTYISSSSTNATITLDFGTDVYNGNGFDISIFFVGGGAQGHTFGLSLPDHLGVYPGTLNFDSTGYAHYEHTGFNLAGSGYSIFRMDIDLDVFGSLGTSPIGTLVLDVSQNSAAPSLVGAYHLQPAAVVPIPLPIILFSSGLVFLGLAGRRKK